MQSSQHDLVRQEQPSLPESNERRPTDAFVERAGREEGKEERPRG
jgi:hypothetical protein